MLIQQVNRDDPDQVYSIFRNRTGGILTRGKASAYEISSDAGTPEFDGVSVRTPGAGSFLVAGVVERAEIEADALGLFQISGFHSALVADSVGFTAGDALKVDAAGDFDVAAVGGVDGGPTIVAIALDNAAASGTGAGLIKCMGL